jgi:hypothetical protein
LASRSTVELFLAPALGLAQPFQARPRDRLGIDRSTLVQALTGIAQPPLAALAAGHELRSLVAAPITERRGLGGVRGDDFLDHRARDVLVAPRAIAAGVGVHLGPVDRDHPDCRQAGVGAQRQDSPKSASARS